MATEAERDQVFDLADSMSIRQIAEAVGISKSAVSRILKARGESRPPGRRKNVPEAEEASAHAPARVLTPAVSHVSRVSRTSRPAVRDMDGVVLSPSMVASVALDHLISEIDLYNEALQEKESSDPQTKQTAEWKVINHEKLVQGHLKIISSWFGMDKGDVLKAIEAVRQDPLKDMSKDELLRLYEATE